MFFVQMLLLSFKQRHNLPLAPTQVLASAITMTVFNLNQVVVAPKHNSKLNQIQTLSISTSKQHTKYKWE